MWTNNGCCDKHGQCKGSHSRPNLQNVVQKGGKGDKSMFQKNEDFLAFWLKIDIRLA